VISGLPTTTTGSIANISPDGTILTIAGPVLTVGSTYVPVYAADALGLIKQTGTGTGAVIDKSTTTIPY
jgi:hypothetical protein